MPIQPALEERMLRGVFRESERSEHHVELEVGGHAHIVTSVGEARVGLFERDVDGEIDELSDITTEPLGYERPTYVHGEETKIRLDGVNGRADAWFLEIDNELMAYGPLATARDLNTLDTIQFEEKLIELS